MLKQLWYQARQQQHSTTDTGPKLLQEHISCCCCCCCCWTQESTKYCIETSRDRKNLVFSIWYFHHADFRNSQGPIE